MGDYHQIDQEGRQSFQSRLKHFEVKISPLHYRNFWLMYKQVGDFRVSRRPPTVPLTRISKIRFKNLPCSRSLKKPCLAFLACSGCGQHHIACDFRRLVGCHWAVISAFSPVMRHLRVNFNKKIRLFIHFSQNFPPLWLLSRWVGTTCICKDLCYLYTMSTHRDKSQATNGNQKYKS